MSIFKVSELPSTSSVNPADLLLVSHGGDSMSTALSVVSEKIGRDNSILDKDNKFTGENEFAGITAESVRAESVSAESLSAVAAPGKSIAITPESIDVKNGLSSYSIGMPGKAGRMLVESDIESKRDNDDLNTYDSEGRVTGTIATESWVGSELSAKVDNSTLSACIDSLSAYVERIAPSEDKMVLKYKSGAVEKTWLKAAEGKYASVGAGVDCRNGVAAGIDSTTVCLSADSVAIGKNAKSTHGNSTSIGYGAESHASGTLNFGNTDDPEKIYFKDKTLKLAVNESVDGANEHFKNAVAEVTYPVIDNVDAMKRDKNDLSVYVMLPEDSWTWHGDDPALVNALNGGHMVPRWSGIDWYGLDIGEYVPDKSDTVHGKDTLIVSLVYRIYVDGEFKYSHVVATRLRSILPTDDTLVKHSELSDYTTYEAAENIASDVVLSSKIPLSNLVNANDVGLVELKDMLPDIKFNNITQPDERFTLITYCNNKFIASTYSRGIWYSNDGINWNQTNITSGGFSETAYGNGKFIIGSDSGKGIWYSNDGINWNQTEQKNFYWTAISYGNGRFIAGNVNSQARGILYSNDGINWNQTNITDKRVQCSVYGNNKFIAGTSFLDGILYSNDGINWNQTNMRSDGWGKILYDNNIFIAGSNSNKGIWYSNDGINWNQTNITSGSFSSIIYYNNQFIVIKNISSGNSIIYYSNDGITWIESDIHTPRSTYFTCGKNLFIISSNPGFWYTSFQKLDRTVPIMQRIKLNGTVLSVDSNNTANIIIPSGITDVSLSGIYDTANESLELSLAVSR